MAKASNGVFTFKVAPASTKHQIKRAVEDTFSVNVTKLTTTTKKPTSKRTGKRKMKSQTKTSKIVRVWLKQGQKIELFEFKDEKNA